MKKITLLTLVGSAILVAGSLFAKEQRIWNGLQNKTWDMITTNWTNPNDGIYPITILGTNTSPDATNYFDDSTDSLNVKVSGTVTMDSLLINSTKNYVIDTIAGAKALITGTGTLVKDGVGNFTMNVKNSLSGGTNLKNGRITMKATTTQNIFGASLTFNGGTANFCTGTASTYPVVTAPVIIPSGVTANVELSRYSYWQSTITGSGDLHIYAGGDRSYIGLIVGSTNKVTYPANWKGFTGNVLVDKYVVTGVTPGFYGLVLTTLKDYASNVIDSTFMFRKLTLGTGTALSTESGTRCYAIGELNSVDSTAWVMGFYKSSNGPKIYYQIGGLNTNVIFPGRIANFNSQTVVGIIKVGTGTYTLTNSNNQIGSSVDIRGGRLFVSDKNLRGNFNGGTGNSVIVRKAGTLGGVGRISGLVDVYGTLQPGADGVGTLSLSDSLSAHPKSIYGTPLSYSFKYYNTAATPVLTTYSVQNGGSRTTDLILREGSTAEFEIANANSFDKVNLSGSIRFCKDSITTVNPKPKLKIKLATGYSIKDGDTFEIIKAKSLNSLSGDFDIEYPSIQGLTWTVATKSDTVKLAKETLTISTHMVTHFSTDTVFVNTVVTDSMRYSYKVTLTAHGSTAVENPKDNSTISVYPNPTKGDVNISSSEAEIATVEILNLQGQSILRKNVRSTKTNINLNSLAPGVYYTKITTANGTKVQKLLKQ